MWRQTARRLRPAADWPIYAAITAARVNDITAAQAMPIEPGATYVFDLGYYDYAWWAKLDAAQCRIVTRLKSNTPLAVVEDLPVPAGTAILSDAIGHLPSRAIRGDESDNSRAAVDVDVAATVHDDLVPGPIGEAAQVGMAHERPVELPA